MRKAVSSNVERDLEVRIDEICDEYESRLRDGQTADLASYLEKVPPECAASTFRQLLPLKWSYETPDPENEIQSFPEFATIVRECQTRYIPLQRKPPRPGENVGRYRIKRKLAAGAFGEVYQGYDEHLQRDVAIKFPNLGRNPTRADADQFRAEARALGALCHPHIVQIYDVIDGHSDWPLMVMEYLVAKPIDVETDQDTFLDHLIDVANAVHFVHQQGYVHRDLKPSNVLVDIGNRAVITDFGLALHDDDRADHRGRSAGTFRYMSPELVRGESHWVDGRTDVWSLGVMLYEHLTGGCPFVDEDEEKLAQSILSCPAKPPRQMRTDCPRRLEQICLRCLEKQPERRYSTAKDLADDLAKFRTRRFPNASKTRALFVAITVAVLLALVVVTGAAERLSFLIRPANVDSGVNQGTIESLPKADTDRVALSVTIDTMRSGPEATEWAPLVDAAPLRPDDRIRIQIQVEEPVYFYLYWFDVDGTRSQVHPVQASALSNDSEPSNELRLPHYLSLTDGRSGTVTLLVLGTRIKTALDDEGLFSHWQPQPTVLRSVVETDFGNLIRGRDRGGVKTDDAFSFQIAENQRVLQKADFDQFCVCRSLCIPFVGNSGE